MQHRRVVTGRDDHGKSVFKSDTEIELDDGVEKLLRRATRSSRTARATAGTIVGWSQPFWRRCWSG